MAYIFFNVILFIIISAFGQDSVTIGTASGSTVSLNSSTSEDTTTVKATGWLSGFVTQINNFPWWFNTLFAMLEISFLALLIYGLIRGL
jgi:hypothetical protein